MVGNRDLTSRLLASLSRWVRVFISRYGNEIYSFLYSYRYLDISIFIYKYNHECKLVFKPVESTREDKGEP